MADDQLPSLPLCKGVNSVPPTGLRRQFAAAVTSSGGDIKRGLGDKLAASCAAELAIAAQTAQITSAYSARRWIGSG